MNINLLFCCRGCGDVWCVGEACFEILLFGSPKKMNYNIFNALYYIHLL